MRNPDITCLPELPPGYVWDGLDSDFNVLTEATNRLEVWIRVSSKDIGEEYQLRAFGKWLSDPTEDLQALVDVTAARFWIGDLPP